MAISKKADASEDGNITQQEFNKWISNNFPSVAIPVDRLQQLNRAPHDITHRYESSRFLHFVC